MWVMKHGTDCCSMRAVLSGGEISHHIVNGARNWHILSQVCHLVPNSLNWSNVKGEAGKRLKEIRYDESPLLFLPTSARPATSHPLQI